MLSSAKNLVIDPNDVDMWKLLAQHTKVCTQFNKLIVMCNNCLCSVYISVYYLFLLIVVITEKPCMLILETQIHF